jgi:hypothetical protein
MNNLVHKLKCKKCLNELLKSTKHVILHDYFLQMGPAFSVRNFEPNEYKASQMI